MAKTTPKANAAYTEALKRIETCRKERRRSLDLSRLGLTSLPPEIGQLTALRKLYLYENPLTALPPEIGQLTALMELDLQRNQLTALPSEIGQLKALTTLHLGYNYLRTLPSEIGQLKALTTLHLRNNQSTKLPSEIGQLTALRKLHLFINDLTTLPPEIGQLTALTTLHVGYNQLTTLPPEIGQLKSLTTLHLVCNCLTKLPPEIGQLKALRTLDLRSNPLTTLPPEISQLKALKTLNLVSNQLTKLPPEINQLTGLTKLNLIDNPLTTLPPEIGQLTALTKLYLTGNQLTTLPPEIGQLTVLTTLNLTRNQLTTLPLEIGQLTALTELSLVDNQLTSLPREIGQLTALTRLDLTGNQLTTLPPEIGQLTALTSLSLHSNQLTTLPGEIGQLMALTELDLADNQFATLPPEIGQLTALTTLSLYHNQFTTLPPEIGQITALTQLYLQSNRLATLPPEIGQLIALTRLDLDSNRLTTLPPEIGQITALTTLSLDFNLLKALPPEMAQLTALTELYLHDNPALGLPEEVLGPIREKVTSGDAKPKPALEILDWYFRNMSAKVKRPILEAKVILIGWGAVGKTSLRRRLIDGTFDEDEDSTHRIEITPWPVKIGNDEVKLHVWDFGGQEIMHATHQFFLTKRSLYVLVLAGREKMQGARDAEHWLRLIKGFRGDSPALVVLNKQRQCPFDLNRQSLQEKYPFIKGFIETDCQPPLHLDELKTLILQEVDQLPELRREFDAKWMAIRDAVTDLKQQGRKRMAVSDYFELCKQKEEHDPQWQKWLLGFLHDLGVVVCFHEDHRLANDGVLDPQWVVDGIYKILNEPALKGGDGRVTRTQIRQLLPDAEYSDNDVGVLTDLLEKFQLCFGLDGSQAELVVPELMTEQEADWKQYFPDLEKCLRFELEYDFLPEGLLPRFIVATHDMSQAGERWRSGVILRRGKNAALVRGDAAGSPPLIRIAVSGPVPPRRELLAVIRREFAKINGSISGLEVRERVPVPGKPGLEPLDYEKLLLRERKGKKTVEVEHGGEILELPLAELLDGIEPKTKRQARAKRISPASGISVGNVEGDLVLGDKHMADENYTITGNVSGIVGKGNTQTITNSFNHCVNPTAAESELDSLKKLLSELQSKLPEDKKQEAALLAKQLEGAVKKNEPESRAWYSISAKGLLEAAKWAKDFTGSIGGALLNLGKAVWPDFQLPEAK